MFDKLSDEARHAVTEVTLDRAANMELAVKQSFPRAKLVTDRFHVQQLVSEAVQDIRIELRRAALQGGERPPQASTAGRQALYPDHVREWRHDQTTSGPEPTPCCSNPRANGMTSRKRAQVSSFSNIHNSSLAMTCR